MAMWSAKLIPVKDVANVITHAVVDPSFRGEGRWRCNRKGYIYDKCQKDKKAVYVFLHRVVLGLPHGVGQEKQGHHVNHDKSDNRRRNLQVVTNRQNCWLRKGARYDSSTGVRGVRWVSRLRKYCATGTGSYGKTIHLGVFATLEDARTVAWRWRDEMTLQAGELSV